MSFQDKNLTHFQSRPYKHALDFRCCGECGLRAELNIHTMNAPEFMLLFRNTALESRLSQEEMTVAMTRLNSWLEQWSGSGHIKSGQPLSYEGKTVSGSKQRMIADGPFAESKEAVGGYVMLQAADFEEALSIANAWPLLDYDCAVEVRPIRVQCPAMELVGLELHQING